MKMAWHFYYGMDSVVIQKPQRRHAGIFKVRNTTELFFTGKACESLTGFIGPNSAALRSAPAAPGYWRRFGLLD